MGRGIRISVETREEILAKLQNGARNVDLALEYGLSEHTIGRISRRFTGNIFKSAVSPRSPKVGAPKVGAPKEGASGSCEFVEIAYSGIPDRNLAKKGSPERLEISVKSAETSLTFDISPCSEQLGLILKLIGSLC